VFQCVFHCGIGTKTYNKLRHAHTHTPHTHTHHTHTPHTHTHTLTHTHTHHTHSHTRIIDTENYILSTFHKTATTGVSVAAHFAPPNKI